MSEGFSEFTFLFICTALVLFMQAGFVCLEVGLIRSKNSTSVAAKNLIDICISFVLFWFVGWGIMMGSSAAGILGTNGYFFDTTDPKVMVYFCFSAVFCGTSATIISGAVAERIKFDGYLIIVCLVSALIYPFFGHWAWNDHGWLKGLGFIDFAGSTVVHSIGGWLALISVIIIGPRHGRFGENRISMGGGNLPLSVAGTFILWFGWLGFNVGSALKPTDQSGQILINTLLAPASGGVTALLITSLLHTRISLPTMMNGILGGAVGITASCNMVGISAAISIGFVSGVLVYLGEQLLEKWEMDDVVAAWPVHGLCGIWGTLAVALYGNTSFLLHQSRIDQISIQVLGIAVAVLWSAGIGGLVLWIINAFFYELRVGIATEDKGLNSAEHGMVTEVEMLNQEMNELEDLLKITKEQNVAETGSASDMELTRKLATRHRRIVAFMNEQRKELETSVRELADSKERLRLLLDSVGSAIMVVDKDGRVVELNTVAQRHFGIVRNMQLDPLTFTQMERNGKTFEELLDRTIQGSAVQETEFCMVQGIKKSYYLGSFFQQKINDKGEFGALVIMQDITKVRELENNTRDNQALLRSVITNLTEGLLLYHPVNGVRFINGRFTELCGFSSDDFLGVNPLMRLIQPAEFQRVERLLSEESGGQHSPVIVETSVRRKNGKLIDGEVRISKCFNVHNEFDGFLVSLTDISERKLSEQAMIDLSLTLEQRVRERTEEVRLANEAKSDFLATMSHEIRTPLNGIIAISELMMKESLPADVAENVRIINGCSQALHHLVNDILDFSKIESGKLELESRVFDVHRAVTDTLDILRPGFVEKGLELGASLSEDVPQFVRGDQVRYKQILLNLLSNALKFTHRGEVRVLVSLVPAHDDNIIRIATSVVDTGIGIPKEKQEIIFNPFAQVDASTTRKYGGTGLGLGICRRLAELQGGRIYLESAEGKGTKFTFEVEFLQRIIPSLSVEASGDAVESVDYLKDRIITLLCNDISNRNALCKRLESWGIKTFSTDNPRTFLSDIQENVKKNICDLIIIDYRMPCVSGAILAQRIGSDPQLQNIPVILFTSDSEPLDVDEDIPFPRIFRALEKPVKTSYLLRAMKEVFAVPEGVIAAVDPGGADSIVYSPLSDEAPVQQSRKKSVLIVEDNPVNQKVCGRLLDRLGAAFTIVNNGDEAIKLLATTRFDLILMDYHMPIMNGLDTTREIRKLEKDTNSHIPIIALTAGAFQEDVEKCREAGMDYYLAKPIDIEKFDAIVSTILQKE